MFVSMYGDMLESATAALTDLSTVSPFIFR